MFRFRKIMVPLDGSAFAESALEPALAIAKAMDADVILYRVAQAIPRMPPLAGMPDFYNEVVATAYREAGDYLQTIRSHLDCDKVMTKYEPASLTVAELILDRAAEHGVDLIVMSSHGRSGVDRWVHGSVTEKVLRGASCATLVIRSHLE